MKKHLFILFVLLGIGSTMFAQHQSLPRQITLSFRFIGTTPPIIPDSYGNTLPCDIEAYQTETGVEIDANEVSLVGFYTIAVMGPREMMYYNSVLLNDGFSVFISTATWPEGTYLLYIEIPGGWLEGEFEIED